MSRMGGWMMSLLLVVLASGCRDPELAKKLDQQQEEISALRSQLSAAHQRLKTRPKDPGTALRAAEDELNRLREQTEQLEAEVVALREKKQSMEKEFAAYRLKYQVK